MAISAKVFLYSLGMAALAVLVAWVCKGLVPTGEMAFVWGSLLGAAVLAVGVSLLAGNMLGNLLGGLEHDLQNLSRGDLAAPNRVNRQDMPVISQCLEDARSLLKFERGLVRGVFDGLPIPFLLVNANEKTTRTNQACLDMLQIDGRVEDCLGKTLAELFYNDASRETVVSRAIRNGEYFHNREVTITGHKGGKVHVLYNVFPIYDEDKTCIGGLCLYVDMSALKQAEELIQQKNAHMDSMIRELTALSEEISGVASTITRSVEQSDKTTVHSASRLSEAATAMNEMNCTVREVARNASEASQASMETKAKAESGAQVVERSLHCIQSVHTVSLELKEDMAELNSHAQAINQIMGVISDIADQTNLLALNAAIEAARAGEAGRGFAVVADEVRKLAEKTMSSTQDVGNAIHAIQGSTHKSSASVERAVTQIEEATRFANESGQALEAIVATAESTADQVNAIATASEEQSAASEEINQSIEEASGLAHETSASVGEVRREVEHLEAVVVRMQDVCREGQKGL